MKLKNRKNGKIIELQVHHIAGKCYESLADVNKDWEDVEEPKDFWYIDDFALMCGTEGEFTTPDLATFTKKDIEKLKAIGNYFESKEEAEHAADKLKAWQRLRDKGFRFEGYDSITRSIDYDVDSNEDIRVELYTLFGGEE